MYKKYRLNIEKKHLLIFLMAFSLCFPLLFCTEQEKDSLFFAAYILIF